MKFLSGPVLISQRSAARVGWALAMAAVVLSVPTFVILPNDDKLVAGPALGVLAVTATLGLRLPWERWNRRSLLAWPLSILLTLFVVGLMLPAQAVVTLTGLTMITFLYVGVFQPRGTGIALVPFGLTVWVTLYGGWSEDLLLRLPITVGVWIVVSEVLSTLCHQGTLMADALRSDARTDALTGLATRRVLTERLDRLRSGDALAVVDLDHCKVVNDQLGHLVGDQVLADLGAAMQRTVRARDLAVRYGGEEFVLVLPDAGATGADATLLRLRDTWATIHPDITFSAGICVVQEQMGPSRALASADDALYAAKRAGRNRWLFAGDEPHNPTPELDPVG